MSEKRGVSAAEKYAELEVAGLERPRCECHGETMGWNKHSSPIAGGYWSCLIKNRERWNNWSSSNRDKIRERDRIRYYSDPEKARERARKYRIEKRDEILERERKRYWERREEIIERKRKYREDNREKFRELGRQSDRRRRSSPEYRRKQTLYMILYQARKKREEYGNKGYTLGDYGQEGSGRRDRTAA